LIRWLTLRQVPRHVATLRQGGSSMDRVDVQSRHSGEGAQMHPDLSKLSRVALVLLLCSQSVHAQSIAFSPAHPSAGDTISVTFRQPFNCTAPVPALVDSTTDSLTFSSTLPSGIVHCPAIPVPEPTTSTFNLALGTLAAGTYAATWNEYLDQSPNPPRLLSTATATLVVGAGVNGPIAVASTPALSTWSLLALAGFCGALGLRRVHRSRARRGLSTEG